MLTPTDDSQRRGGSLLREHQAELAAHGEGDSSATVDELLQRFDIPREDLEAWEATRNMWAGAPLASDEEASVDHLLDVLASLHAELEAALECEGKDRAVRLSIHDAIGWICSTWSQVPATRHETTSDVILSYSAAPGSWLFHAAGIPPEEVEHVSPGAVEIVAILAAARGAHLPPRH
ncbi:hypothetical protein [Knoellia sp. Soil729]|uniref:hypothetical protein n=1 Tax=Knoellia sp. Soil729 TaxID=1736394 RepID=UPI0006F991CB|nr:hypothetical protein [Knoellia sp. Soil729]KRE42942.1 hypothetical protein ASG74_11375 [Knoellia sp. Soil729]